MLNSFLAIRSLDIGHCINAYCIQLLSNNLFSFWSVDFGCRTQVHFAGKGDCFAKRGMGVDRFGNVSHGAAHFDCHYGLGNQFPCARTNNAAA